jgi:hypothetical protein
MDLDEFPPNTALGIKVTNDVYGAGLRRGLDMYPIAPPFYISIYFFQADDYVLGYGQKNITDYCDVSDCLLNMEFKYFINQLGLHDPRALALLYLDKKAYVYRDFYGRALLDNNHLFHPDTYNPQAIDALAKEVLYDYIVSHHSD